MKAKSTLTWDNVEAACPEELKPLMQALDAESDSLSDGYNWYTDPDGYLEVVKRIGIHIGLYKEPVKAPEVLEGVSHCRNCGTTERNCDCYSSGVSDRDNMRSSGGCSDCGN